MSKKNTATDSVGRSAREKAAAARVAAEAADQRRRRLINVSVSVVVVLLVVGLVGGAWWTSRSNREVVIPNVAAAVPVGAFPADNLYAYGIPVNSAADGRPVLQVWEDFQCPACQSFEAAFGETLNALVDSGDVRLVWRSTSFLDGKFPGDHSKRAAAAFGCAVDAGVGREYHDVVFANAPAVEGDGWTDEQLVAFGVDAGLSGDEHASFEECVTDRRYVTWAVNSTQRMQEEGVGGTPTLVLNGEPVEGAATQDPTVLRELIRDAPSSQS